MIESGGIDTPIFFSVLCQEKCADSSYFIHIQQRVSGFIAFASGKFLFFNQNAALLNYIKKQICTF